MIVYLANPYGFSDQQNKILLPKIIKRIKVHGHEVWEPFSRNNNVDKNDPDWPYYVGQADMRDVKNCDAIFAIINGSPPDEGVMVELGMAIAWEKEIYLFRDDFRICNGDVKYPLNLMIFCGLSKDHWDTHFFNNVNKICF